MDNMNKYEVTWMGESETQFEVNMTAEEVETINKFMKYAHKDGGVPHYDMPYIRFEEVK